MQVVVKRPNINIDIKGDSIPENLLEVLKEDFGNDVKIIDTPEQELVRAKDTQFYKKVKASMSAGDYIRIDRENMKLTQAQFGNKLGSYSRQYISDVENGRRKVSFNFAKNWQSFLIDQ